MASLPALAFIVELEKLKTILRKNKPLGQTRYENSAEHSWQISMAAMVLAPEVPGVDLARVIEMLLVHDIPEIDIGDTIVYAERTALDHVQEHNAARRIFGLLDARTSAHLFSRWEEFERGESLEAQFARAIDRLLPVLQNVHNYGQSWMENGITLEQVLRKNALIGETFPQCWAEIEPQIRRIFLERT